MDLAATASGYILLLIALGAFAYLFFFGMLGAWVAEQKGRSAFEGAVLAVLFNFYGVILEALLPEFPDDRRYRDRWDGRP